MDEEEKEYRNYSSGGGIIGLIILIAIGWWGYRHFFPDYSKPWWNGTKVQNVCIVHNPNFDDCFRVPVTVEDKRITSIDLPVSGYRAIGTMDCGKAVSFEGRYCVVSDVGGRNEWQVQSN